MSSQSIRRLCTRWGNGLHIQALISRKVRRHFKHRLSVIIIFPGRDNYMHTLYEVSAFLFGTLTVSFMFTRECGKPDINNSTEGTHGSWLFADLLLYPFQACLFMLLVYTLISLCYNSGRTRCLVQNQGVHGLVANHYKRGTTPAWLRLGLELWEVCSTFFQELFGTLSMQLYRSIWASFNMSCHSRGRFLTSNAYPQFVGAQVRFLHRT